jgi:mannose-6-phosphate isomerase-like protein (cupin superfamily)
MADNGPAPFVTDIESTTRANNTFRTTIWTGRHLQLTVMCLQPEEEIGLEVHHDRDQFIRIEQGAGRVVMGETRDDLSFKREVAEDDVVLVPAGSWHNVTNTGDEPLRLYSVYGPAEHEPGTVHLTKAEADAAEHDH